MIGRVVLEVSGTCLVLFTLHEVFRDIFHPTRSGSLSDLVGWVASETMRHTPLRPAIGPLALVGVITTWVMLLSFGFALIYCGLYPDFFLVPPSQGHLALGQRFVRSCYLSLGSLDTFQTFDMQPGPSWLKLILGVQGLLGLAMITASVSWLVLLYPALSRGRFFANRVFLLLEAQRRSGISIVTSEHPLLAELARELTQVRIDLILFPVLLNFYPADRSATLALALPHLVTLAREGDSMDLPISVRFGAAQLNATLDKFSLMLADRVLSTKEQDRDKVFQAFADRDR